MIPAHQTVSPLKWNAAPAQASRDVPEETAVAIVINGATQAVMMATPADLEDFAVGFCLTEGLIASPDAIESLALVEHDNGIEARLFVADASAKALAVRRRALAGPTGCGLCGIESLDQAMRQVPPVSSDLAIGADDVLDAMAALRPAQSLNAVTHAVHAAALWSPAEGLIVLREDVGRHNALDKLVGAVRRAGTDTSGAALLLTSRVSIEMVQKAAVLGTGILVAVSAPTSAAIRVAEEADITLAAIARADGFEIFTHPRRIGGRVVALHRPG